MRRLEDQNHYEVLEVGRTAERLEIEQAYRGLQATYASDSLALYSLFDEGDSSALQKRIEEAHRVLSNAEARREYDAEIGVDSDERAPTLKKNGAGEKNANEGASESLEAAIRAVDLDETSPDDTNALIASEVADRDSDLLPSQSSELASSIEGFQDLEGDGDEDGDFDGARLRRARLRRGIELDQISNVTKISAAFLGALEEEAFQDLPARVYVRGFVIAYARAIGLEAKAVATSYMTLLDDSGGGHRRQRLLGRR